MRAKETPAAKPLATTPAAKPLATTPVVPAPKQNMKWLPDVSYTGGTSLGWGIMPLAAGTMPKIASDVQEFLSVRKAPCIAVGYYEGPNTVGIELKPREGFRLDGAKKLEPDMEIVLGSTGEVKKINGKLWVILQKPKEERIKLDPRPLLKAACTSPARIPIYLGVNEVGQAVTMDLVEAPHILIAGTTRSGKSVAVSHILANIIHVMGETCYPIIIDPKQVDYPWVSKLFWQHEHHTSCAATLECLNKVVGWMEQRYAALAAKGLTNIWENPNGALEHKPIVVVIDEFADFMMSGNKEEAKELERLLIRIAQKGRAAGIHLILSTQKPTVNVVTSQLKGNIPTRLALRVVTAAESRVILDDVGAEDLLGFGDALLLDDRGMQRLQMPFIPGGWMKDYIERGNVNAGSKS